MIRMLVLSDTLVHKAVLSLRSGGPVAYVQAPIFNPRNLKVEGFYVSDSVDKRPLILLDQDIRESSPRGYIINDHDVLAEPDDLVRLQNVLAMDFQLIGKPVQTVGRESVGKVSDYAVETTTMYVQKLYVAQSLWKRLTGGELSVDRSQIVEITNRRVIIQDPLRPTPSTAMAPAA